MTRKRRSKMRHLCFHPKDADAFSDAMKERWPTVKFQTHTYLSLQRKNIENDDDWKNIPFYESINATPNWRVQIWVEPEGWKPRWAKRKNEYGVYRITNEPILQFVYDISEFMQREGLGVDQPDLNLRSGRIWAYFNDGDKEHERFLNAVWRMTAKLSTNIVDVLDWETGEVKYPSQRIFGRCGYHALDWCREDPRRRLDQNLRPAD